jgi:hypothetical protein
MAKAVATKEDTAVGAVGISQDALAAYAGQPTGFEKDRTSDFIVPFFTILQGLSPQMQTVEGAKLGKIINTSTNEMFDTINLVVCQKVVKFVEWAPNRGGLVAVHEPNSDFVKALQKEVGDDKFAKLITKEGNDVTEVKYILGAQCDENKKPMGFATIGFSVTKIKKFNAWNTDARNKLGQFGLPLHALVWTFGVMKDKNKKGEFFNWTHSLFGSNVKSAIVDPKADAELFDAVKGLMSREDVKIDHAQGAGEAGDDDGDAM